MTPDLMPIDAGFSSRQADDRAAILSLGCSTQAL